MAIVALLFANCLVAEELSSVENLRATTHIHGISVDRVDPNFLLIATHHGLFRAGSDGRAQRISIVQDFMGFTPHPTDASVLFASGHPAAGGNLGFIISNDAGKTWTQVSAGVDEPADFHKLAVGAADTATFYGVYKGLQRSRDGGKSWERVGPSPARLVDLSASAREADVLYAATETGLLVSHDAGGSWKPLLDAVAVTMVAATVRGDIYAFLYGQGLMHSQEGSTNWARVGDSWGEQFILHMAIDPNDPLRMFAATGEGRLLVSKDGGVAWSPFDE